MNGGEDQRGHPDAHISQDPEINVFDIARAKERRLAEKSPVGDYMLRTCDTPKFNNEEAEQQIIERLPKVVESVAETMFGDEAALDFLGVNVDFLSSAQLKRREQYEESLSEETTERKVKGLGLFERIIPEKEQSMFEVIDYENDRIISPQTGSVLPHVLIFVNKPKIHIIPTLDGGAEFRRLSPAVGELDEATKILFYIAVGVAQAALYKGEKLDVGARMTLSPTITESFTNQEDLIDSGENAPKINIRNFGKKRINLIHKYQFLLGIAAEASTRSEEELYRLVDALAERYREEIPDFERDTSGFERLIEAGLIRDGGDELTSKMLAAKYMDNLSLRESDIEILSELWIAAGHPIVGKELHGVLSKLQNVLTKIRVEK